MPDGNWTLRDAVSVIALGASEPSNSQRLIGDTEEVRMLLSERNFLSIKESVEPESSKEINLSIHEVSESSEQENSEVRVIQREQSKSERVDTLSTMSPGKV